MEEQYATEAKECKQCKKGLSKTQIGMVIFSGYLLVSAIYGTYKIIENVLNIF